MQPRLVIAGTGSGAGKTTFTIGLLAALKQKGLNVQGFKCGPDYIDPSYHTAVTGRPSRNLDSWMLEADKVKDIFARGSKEADISVIEGVMGLYDGKRPDADTGSTAEISHILEAPVLLVVNIASMARSTAAIVKGFQTLSSHTNIAGVLLNHAGSDGHAKLCQKAIEQECSVPVLGWLKKGDTPAIPERHLGLIPAIERGELDPFFDELGHIVSEQVDIDKLIELSQQVSEIPYTGCLFSEETFRQKKVNLAVAYDAAFNFYYPENLELLEQAGAELIYFSPLHGDVLPKDCDGLYIGGGFPEEFAKELTEKEEVKQSIVEAVDKGMPLFAECGGYMYLTERMITTNDSAHEMLGVIPAEVHMHERLQSLGYREVTALNDTVILSENEQAKGHEFHYSSLTSHQSFSSPYNIKALRKEKEEGFCTSNITAGYTHIHFASNPRIPERFVANCESWKKERVSRD